VPFDPELHDAYSFDCGNPTLNRWMQSRAAHAIMLKTAGVYVWAQQGKVVGYYAVTPHTIQPVDVPTKLTAGARNPISAYLLGKLALDSSMQGRGNGTSLLYDALTRLLYAADHVPARLFAVDPIDDAAVQFHRKHEFKGPVTEGGPMVIKTTTAAALIR
jgi:GNAT superfamily N-acetyltransferase